MSLDNQKIISLSLLDLAQIVEIEERVYLQPWSKGNFIDSFSSGHIFFGLKDQQQKLFAYFVLMPVIDELHLLTFAVAREKQKLGYARILLDAMCEYAKDNQFESIMLEVRVSNLRAIEIYKKFGFQEIGYRKNYYPAFEQTREDAIVMRVSI